MKRPSALSLDILPGLPLVGPGDDLGEALAVSLAQIGGLETGDVVVVAQKVVSKTEGRIVRLTDVAVGPRAREIALICRKEPALVQLVLDESIEVVRAVPQVLIVRHKLGFILANAGIDQSNVDHAGGACALLLPIDPDKSAEQLRATLCGRFGVTAGVIIADSFGRPWRLGTTGTCIGAAGVPTLMDLRGRLDLFGRALEVSQQAVGDEIAAAASLLMGQASEGCPAVRIRGLRLDVEGRSTDLLRRSEEDLFR